MFSPRSPKNIESESDYDSKEYKEEDYLDFDTDFLMVTVNDEYENTR